MVVFDFGEAHRHIRLVGSQGTKTKKKEKIPPQLLPIMQTHKPWKTLAAVELQRGCQRQRLTLQPGPSLAQAGNLNHGWKRQQRCNKVVTGEMTW